MLGHGVIPHVGEVGVGQAFYLSKMTVVEEVDFSNFEYTYIHWPEFVEFIGRLALIKYRGTYQDEEWPLEKKIGVILTCVLKLVHEETKWPPELREVISDSDDDY